jgi:hypothetical protein
MQSSNATKQTGRKMDWRMSLLWFNGGIISLKITQEVFEKVEAFVTELNGKAKFYWPDDEYRAHFFNEEKHQLDNPWVSIDFGHHSIEAGIIVELKKRFPDAVIYISGMDSDVSVSLHEKTYEQMEKEQMEYNLIEAERCKKEFIESAKSEAEL